jgi:hypothetical protein
VYPARLCSSRDVVETGELSLVAPCSRRRPSGRRGGACPARPARRATSSRPTHACVRNPLHRSSISRHKKTQRQDRLRRAAQGPPLRHGGDVVRNCGLRRASRSRRSGEIDRGGRPVPSVVGHDGGRGTRHAAGSPPHTTAPTARGEVVKNCGLGLTPPPVESQELIGSQEFGARLLNSQLTTHSARMTGTIFVRPGSNSRGRSPGRASESVDSPRGQTLDCSPERSLRLDWNDGAA